MSEENKNLPVDETEVVVDEKKSKDAKKPAKKSNFFVRVWGKLVKLVKDVKGEMKKVVWTPKDELKKSSKLVILSVVAVCIAIAVIDVCASLLINSLAGLVG